MAELFYVGRCTNCDAPTIPETHERYKAYPPDGSRARVNCSALCRHLTANRLAVDCPLPVAVCYHHVPGAVLDYTTGKNLT